MASTRASSSLGTASLLLCLVLISNLGTIDAGLPGFFGNPQEWLENFENLASRLEHFKDIPLDQLRDFMMTIQDNSSEIEQYCPQMPDELVCKTWDCVNRNKAIEGFEKALSACSQVAH